MILTMQKVRILGPRSRLEEVLRLLQDFGLLHLCEAEAEVSLREVSLTPQQGRHLRYVRAALEDVDAALTPGEQPPPPPAPERFTTADLARFARLARRTRRRLEALAHRRREREEERARVARLREFFSVLPPLAEGAALRRARVLYLMLPEGGADPPARLRGALARAVGAGFALDWAPLESGGAAVAVTVPAERVETVETLLAQEGIRDLELPERFGTSPATALPAMDARLAALDAELAGIDAERESLVRSDAAELVRARAALEDHLREIEALGVARETPHAFVLEGWVPEPAFAELVARLRDQAGDDVVVESLGRETWSAEDAPVSLSNPRLFRPFEALTRLLPLPTYGSIDPTPFVGIFFPMFFGVILGDIGYGAALAVVALLARAYSRRGSLLRSVSEIAGACAVFTILFGILYGELLGDLGRRAFGLRPLAFGREEALVPFLGLAVAIGFVHVLLGLILGAIATIRSEPRRSLGRSLAALMTLLVAAALLAALQVLPSAFFTPAIVVLLLIFPVFVIVEGVIGPIEMLSTLSNVLSYARIMALGTASVMMAIAANQMVGAFGSVTVGVVFALLFHLVNFLLGVFSPTVHALRLHYVEFFGKFYSPGGMAYRPFRHWRPRDATTV